jgi:isopentenyl diphosphate isomerase/L-lactate dehydrogenase-like FMN-dependent dehydrogenase
MSDVGKTPETGLLIQDRKSDHIRICLSEHVEFKTKTTGFEEYDFIHQALPEINKSDIDISLDLSFAHFTYNMLNSV